MVSRNQLKAPRGPRQPTPQPARPGRDGTQDVALRLSWDLEGDLHSPGGSLQTAWPGHEEPPGAAQGRERDPYAPEQSQPHRQPENWGEGKGTPHSSLQTPWPLNQGRPAEPEPLGPWICHTGFLQGLTPGVLGSYSRQQEASWTPLAWG